MRFKTIVDCKTLAKKLDNREWVVFDCRFALTKPEQGYKEYKESHIPSSRYADLDRNLASPKQDTTGRHPLPDSVAFVAWLRANGVNNSSQVVVYDANSGMFASRLWWMLRWLGHQDVAVLDGGWPAWLAGDYPVSIDIPQPKSGDFEGRPNDGMWVSTKDIEEVVMSKDDSTKIVDARIEPRFKGEFEPIDPVAGHIPGAENYPCANNVDESGYFLSSEHLRKNLSSIVDEHDAGDIVNMCGSGVTACRNILAMEMAGWPGTRLYVGSWSEWITDPKRPIEKEK